MADDIKNELHNSDDDALDLERGFEVPAVDLTPDLDADETDNEAVTAMLNAEDFERQKVADNFQSFSNAGHDYSDSAQHFAYVRAEAVKGEPAAVIDAGAYSTLRENYENSKTLFRSYDEQVPEAVVAQYQEAADRFFVVAQQTEAGTLRVVETPVFGGQAQPAQPFSPGNVGGIVQGAGYEDSHAPYGSGHPLGTEGVQRVDAWQPPMGAGHMQPAGGYSSGIEQHFGTDPSPSIIAQPHNGAEPSVPLVAQVAPGQYADVSYPLKDTGSTFDIGAPDLGMTPGPFSIPSVGPECTAPAQNQGNSYGAVFFNPVTQSDDCINSPDSVVPVFEHFAAQKSGPEGAMPVDRYYSETSGAFGQDRSYNIPVAPVFENRPVVHTISQERYDALSAMFAESKAEMSSYGPGKVPEHVQTRYDGVYNLYTSIQQKIDNGSLAVVDPSMTAGAAHSFGPGHVGGFVHSGNHGDSNVPYGSGHPLDTEGVQRVDAWQPHVGARYERPEGEHHLSGVKQHFGVEPSTSFVAQRQYTEASYSAQDADTPFGTPGFSGAPNEVMPLGGNSVPRESSRLSPISQNMARYAAGVYATTHENAGLPLVRSDAQVSNVVFDSNGFGRAYSSENEPTYRSVGNLNGSTAPGLNRHYSAGPVYTGTAQDQGNPFSSHGFDQSENAVSPTIIDGHRVPIHGYYGVPQNDGPNREPVVIFDGQNAPSGPILSGFVPQSVERVNDTVLRAPVIGPRSTQKHGTEGALSGDGHYPEARVAAGQDRNRNSAVGSVSDNRPVVHTILQERYDSLSAKYAEAKAELASYGQGKVPEHVQARYDQVHSLYTGIRQKIDSGTIAVVTTAARAGAPGVPAVRETRGAGSNHPAVMGQTVEHLPVNTISQARFDALAKKNASLKKEIASYGDKEVPVALRARAERVDRLYNGLRQKISDGTITVGSTPAAGRARDLARSTPGQNHSHAAGSTANGSFAQGTQAFFDISRDNFEPGAKRVGNRHIKPPKSPFQGSPLNKYDKLKIQQSHNYIRPFEVATRRTLRALSDTIVYSAAQNEQTGSANAALITAQRARDAQNAVRVLVASPQQVLAVGRTVSDAGRTVANVGRFLKGKEPLARKEREAVTVRALDKQYKGFFTEDERASFKRRYGDDVYLSSGQVRRKLIAQDEKVRVLDKEINTVRNKVMPATAGEREQWSKLKKHKAAEQAKLNKLFGEKNALVAKNRALKKEIKALQDKGPALTADERKHLKDLMKKKADADQQLRKFSGKVEAQKLKVKGLKNEMRAVETKVATVSSSIRKDTKPLIRQKVASTEKARRLRSLKNAQADAVRRNKRADWVSEKSGKKTIRKVDKEKLKLNYKDKGVLERLKDRQVYAQKRKKLMKVKNARRQLIMSLGSVLGRAARESEDSSIRTLMAADRMRQNRYLRTVLRYTAKTALLPVVLAKKAAVGSYHIGRVLDANLNGGRIGAKIDGSVAAVHRTVRNVEAAATKTVTNSRIYKELNGGLYNRAKDKISSKIPDRIKTRAKKVTDGLNGINTKRKEILGKFNRLKEKIKQSKVGQAFSALGKGAKGVGKAFSFAKNAMLKIGLAAGGALIVICLIGAFITAAGGVAGTLIFGDSSNDGRISLDSYIDVLNREQKKINKTVADYKSDTEDNGGAYKRVYVDYVGNGGANNYKEILSMAAVYFDQDLTNGSAVVNYIKQLFQASNYVTTSESAMYYCSGCVTRSYHCYDQYDQYATDSRIALYNHSDHSGEANVGNSWAAQHGCVKGAYYSCITLLNPNGCYQHNGGATMDDPGDCDNYSRWLTNPIRHPKEDPVYAYKCLGHCHGKHYDYSCPGHKEKVCYGHIDLYVNVVTLGFDKIFAVDPGIIVGGDYGDYEQGDLIGTFNITYYCAEKYPHICNAGPPYKTASGTEVTAGRTIAVDKNVIPLGTPVIINGHLYIAEDTGGAIKGNRIDIAVETHQEALNLGRDVFKVYSATASTEGEDKVETQRRFIDYKALASEAAGGNFTTAGVLRCFGLSKEPEVKWVEGYYNAGTEMFPNMKPYTTEDSYIDSLQNFDLKHQSEPFTNAELNTFHYVKMSLADLKALVKERGLDHKDYNALDIIRKVLIPYDKAHPDVYVDPTDDPASGSGSSFYFGGWDDDNKRWVKDIYANMNSENYSGLDKILGHSSSGVSGDDVSLEGLVIQGSKIAVTYYSQHDPRWANRPIRSDSPENTISKAGCGFTSMAIVVSSMTSNTIDPPGMCAKYGRTHYAIGQGAYHSLISDVSAAYGLSCTELRNSNVQGVIDALKQGKLVVALVGRGGYGWTGSGYYTGYGHFLVICGVTADGAFLLADPDRADVSASGQGVTIDYFVDSGIKKFWVIGK